MKWNDHSKLVGTHAFLAPSHYAWIRYDDEKLLQAKENSNAAAYGTEMHDIAAKLIKNRITLPRKKITLNMYVNDAIGYRMDPEIPLYYSDEAYGTADAIRFDDKTKLLRIHDLKMGHSGDMDQLKIYTAFFCLEYKKAPVDIKMELRLYKENDVEILEPDPDEIRYIMDKTIHFDKLLKEG